MKLASRYDLEAPIGRVFGELVNFDQWERAGMRRGTDVTRTDTLKSPGPGMTWVTQFRHRGRQRTATLRIDRILAPDRLDLAALSAQANAAIEIELLELAPRRTRLQVTVDLQPKTLTAKIYVQSLKLAKSRVERTFQSRLAQFVLELEDRIRRG